MKLTKNRKLKEFKKLRNSQISFLQLGNIRWRRRVKGKSETWCSTIQELVMAGTKKKKQQCRVNQREVKGISAELISLEYSEVGIIEHNSCMYFVRKNKQNASENGITYCELNTGTICVVRKGKEKDTFRIFSSIPRKKKKHSTEMNGKE